MVSSSSAGHLPVIDFAGASIRGRRREINEDAWAAVPEAGVFLVADGCGGRSSGRPAADIALAAVERIFSSGVPTVAGIEPLCAAIGDANQRVSEAAVGELQGMSAALAALRLAPPWVVTSVVGDCRVYRYRVDGTATRELKDARDGVLTRLTTDDLLWVSLLQSGASVEKTIETYQDLSSVVIKALGTQPRIDVRVHYSSLEPGDLYLLCSDGVTRQLEDSDIQACISRKDTPLATRCQHLLELSDERGGHDNVTAVLVQC